MDLGFLGVDLGGSWILWEWILVDLGFLGVDLGGFWISGGGS